jgi:hypothetical protein
MAAAKSTQQRLAEAQALNDRRVRGPKNSPAQQHMERSSRLNRSRQQAKNGQDNAPQNPQASQNTRQQLAQGQQQSRLRNLANAGIPLMGMNRRDEKPASLKTREGQSAQRSIDRDMPESMKPRGNEVDATSPNQLRAQMSRLKNRLSRAKSDEAKGEIEQVIEKQRMRLRKAVKRKVEAGAKRGIIWTVDAIAGLLDLGTSGISTLIDIFFYIFTFAWIDLEWIYGKHMRKGKDPLISPLSWDPIPMPVDENAVILEALVLSANIVLFVLIVLLVGIGVCLSYDYYLLTSSTVAFVKGVVGGGGNTCTGGIIHLIFF